MINYPAYLDADAYSHFIKCQNAVSGSSSSVNDAKMAANVVQSLLSESLEQVYIKKFVTEQARADIAKLCNDVIAQYNSILKSENWLSETTKQKALEKLNSIQVNALYPSKNSITILTGIIGGSFYRNDMNIEEKYAPLK